MSEKKFSPFDECSCFVCLRRQNKQKKFRLYVCMSVCLAVRTWTFHVDTITFEEVNGSKQNLVAVFYVRNVGLVLILDASKKTGNIPMGISQGFYYMFQLFLELYMPLFDKNHDRNINKNSSLMTHLCDGELNLDINFFS